MVNLFDVFFRFIHNWASCAGFRILIVENIVFLRRTIDKDEMMMIQMKRRQHYKEDGPVFRHLLQFHLLQFHSVFK